MSVDGGRAARTSFGGWGRSTSSRAVRVEARRPVEVVEAVVGAAGRGVLARGAGRSYNDAAQNGGGALVTQPEPTITIDPTTGRATASAGATIEQVLSVLVPHGRFVPVTPGTRLATIGGCVAADVHGKNHHRDGSWGEHLTAIELVDGHGDRRHLDPVATPSEFWATVGGMGLSGIILSATFDTIPIRSDQLAVTTTRTGDFDATLAALAEAEDGHRYAVAWVDTSATGSRRGRGVVSGGDHLDAADAARGSGEMAYAPGSPIPVPPTVGRGPALIRPATIRWFNRLWYHKVPRRATEVPTSIGAFFHPLDGLGRWNRLYGRRGFVQYQSVVPAPDDVLAQLDALSAGGATSALTVVKRFGSASPAMLGFPCPGWTLAVDVPTAVPRLAATLDRLDRIVVEAGGRIYLAKDGRTSIPAVARMYPRLGEWRRAVDKLDPQGRFQSDLARRLGLRTGGPT